MHVLGNNVPLDCRRKLLEENSLDIMIKVLKISLDFHHAYEEQCLLHLVYKVFSRRIRSHVRNGGGLVNDEDTQQK
jgi:hypothetical protein